MSLQASEFGGVRPSASDIRRHVENLRDKAVEKSHTAYFRVKRVRCESRDSRGRHSRSFDKLPSSGSGLDRDQPDETGGDCSTAKRHPDNPSSQTLYRTLETNSGRRDGQPTPRSEKLHNHPASKDHDDRLPSSSKSIAAKSNKDDNMKLRPIPRQSYSDDFFSPEGDDEYDPDVERAKEERREAQSDRRRQRALLDVQRSGT